MEDDCEIGYRIWQENPTRQTLETMKDDNESQRDTFIRAMKA